MLRSRNFRAADLQEQAAGPPANPVEMGDQTALTTRELAGYETFKENACATCHTGVNMGGKTFEKLTNYGDYFGDRIPEIQANGDDEGLKSFTGKAEDLHKFKVPTLRNITRTAPYFHDGQYMTLEEAIRAAGKYIAGRELTDEQVAAIGFFMEALEGKSPYFVNK